MGALKMFLSDDTYLLCEIKGILISKIINYQIKSQLNFKLWRNEQFFVL